VVQVQEWAEIRAMKAVKGLSIKEIARRTGHSRNTIRAALRSPEPPRYGPRASRPSKLDPFKAKIHELLGEDGAIPSQVIRDQITAAGYGGGKTILDDYVRELRPVFAPPRTFQRTHYEPGELVQFDLWEPSKPIPVGHGQTRRGWVVTCCSGYSRAGAGTLVFSKQAPDILWGMSRCLARLGALPRKVVWDREWRVRLRAQAGGLRHRPPRISRPSTSSSSRYARANLRRWMRSPTVACLRQRLRSSTALTAPGLHFA